MLPLLSYPNVLVLFVVTNPQVPVDTIATFYRHHVKKGLSLSLIKT